MNEEEALEYIKQKVVELENVLNKLRYVSEGDAVYTNDFNLKLEALNILKDIFKVAEDVKWLPFMYSMSYQLGLGFISKKEYGDYVKSKDWEDVSKLIIQAYDISHKLWICFTKIDWSMFRKTINRIGYHDTVPCYCICGGYNALIKLSPTTGFIFRYSIGDVRVSPSLDKDGNIYFAPFYDDGIYCVDEKGFLVWEYISGCGHISSPYIDCDKNVLYIGRGSAYKEWAQCLDIISLTLNGELLWRYRIGYGEEAKVFASPVKYVYVITGAINGYLYMLDENGNLVISVDCGGAIYSSPTIYENCVFISTENGELLKIDLNGSILWRIHFNAGLYSTPAIYNSLIYLGGDSSSVYCISTDGNIVWKTHTPSPFDKSTASSPAVKPYEFVCIGAGMNWWATAPQPAFYCLDLDGNILWVYHVKWALTTSPAVDIHGNIFINDGYYAIAIFEKTGYIIYYYVIYDGAMVTLYQSSVAIT